MSDEVLRLNWTGDGVQVCSADGIVTIAVADVPTRLATVCADRADSATEIRIAARPGLVAVAGDGSVLRVVDGTDPDTSPDAGWLTKQLPDGAAGWEAAVGSAPQAAWLLAKLSWLHRSDAEAWGSLDRALTPLAWVACALTGEAVTDIADAATTGAWAATGGWRADLLAIVDGARDWSGALPAVVAAGTELGTWRGLAVRAAG